jgi:hypothetical protein
MASGISIGLHLNSSPLESPYHFGLHPPIGAGSFQTIWGDTYVVEFQTAREEQVIKLILASLDTKLPPAINTFVEE